MPVGLPVIFRSIILTLGRQLTGSAFNLVTFIVIARALGPEGAGRFTLAMLLPMMLTQLLNLGLASSNVYFISSGRVTFQRAWCTTRNVSGVLISIGLMAGLCTALLWSDVILPGVDIELLTIGLIIFPFSFVNAIVISFFQAREDFSSYNRVVLLQPFVAVVSVIVMAASGFLTVQNALLCTLGSQICASIGGLLALSRVVPLGAQETELFPYLKKMLAYGLKVHISNNVAFINRRLDLFLVNILVSTEASGLLAVANRIIEQLWILATAISTVLFPRLSSLDDDDPQRVELTELMSRVAFWVSLIAAAILAAILAPMLKLLFGSEFLPVECIVLVLLPGAALRSVSQILANDIAARGKVGLNLLLGILVLTINLGLNLHLIPIYGVLGAAAATSLAYISMALLRVVLQQHMTDLRWLNIVLPQSSDMAAIKKLYAERKLRKNAR